MARGLHKVGVTRSRTDEQACGDALLLGTRLYRVRRTAGRTYVSHQFSHHPIPRVILTLCSVLAIFYGPNFILKVHNRGYFLGQVGTIALVLIVADKYLSGLVGLGVEIRFRLQCRNRTTQQQTAQPLVSQFFFVSSIVQTYRF